MTVALVYGSISEIGCRDCGSIDVIWDKIDDGPSGGLVLLGVYSPMNEASSMNSSIVAVKQKQKRRGSVIRGTQTISSKCCWSTEVQNIQKSSKSLPKIAMK